MKYYPVGTVFSYDGVRLKVKAIAYNNAVCTGCYFSDWERRKMGLSKFSCCIHSIACTAHLRKDKRHVVFIQVKE